MFSFGLLIVRSRKKRLYNAVNLFAQSLTTPEKVCSLDRKPRKKLHSCSSREKKGHKSVLMMQKKVCQKTKKVNKISHKMSKQLSMSKQTALIIVQHTGLSSIHIAGSANLYRAHNKDIFSIIYSFSHHLITSVHKLEQT
jgi:hypothetical protein